MRVYVFVYGSLLDPASVSRTVQRPVTPDDLLDAVLLDHERDWGIRIPVQSVSLGGPVNARFLDVVPRPGAYVNGAVLAVSDADLRHLAAREAQYDVVDVSAQAIAPIPPGATVVTFRGRADHRHDRPGVRSAVPERYREWVERTVAGRGALFAERFARTTAAPPPESFPGEYTFSDPAQAAAARRPATD
jgi:hypothetical protein